MSHVRGEPEVAGAWPSVAIDPQQTCHQTVQVKCEFVPAADSSARHRANCMHRSIGAWSDCSCQWETCVPVAIIVPMPVARHLSCRSRVERPGLRYAESS